ncbi:MAG: hypothetical protein V3V33_06920 [Candidatus Lokiarchaeia archaeon]
MLECTVRPIRRFLDILALRTIGGQTLNSLKPYFECSKGQRDEDFCQPPYNILSECYAFPSHPFSRLYQSLLVRCPYIHSVILWL